MNDFTTTAKIAIVHMLLSRKCANYGYDGRDFRRVSNQRSRARKALKNTPIDALHFGVIGSRLQFVNGEPTYIVGQSENEEITNVMRALVSPTAGWVS